MAQNLGGACGGVNKRGTLHRVTGNALKKGNSLKKHAHMLGGWVCVNKRYRGGGRQALHTCEQAIHTRTGTTHLLTVALFIASQR